MRILALALLLSGCSPVDVSESQQEARRCRPRSRWAPCIECCQERHPLGGVPLSECLDEMAAGQGECGFCGATPFDASAPSDFSTVPRDGGGANPF